jgi:MFS family permease
MTVTRLLRDSFKEIGATDFSKFALLQAVFGMASMWMIVFVLELEQAPARSFLILGTAEILAFTLLGLITHRHGQRHQLWYTILLAAILCWLVAAPLSIAGAGWALTVAMTTGMALLATLKRAIIADTLFQVQSGEKRHLKLALMYLLTPLITIGLSIALGFAGKTGIWLAFMLLAAILAAAAMRWYGHVPLKTAGISVTRARLAGISPKARIQLIMGTLVNMIDTPLRFVMTPLFIYSYFDGQLGKVGTALGLLSLIVLIGSIVRYGLQKQRKLPLGTIMFTSVIVFAGMIIVWGLYYTSPLIVMAVFCLRAIMAPIWTFGFYASLQHQDEANFHMNAHSYALLTNAAHATGFLIMALTGSYAFQASASYVLIAGLAETAIVLAGLILWLLAPDKMTARANE